MKDRQVFRRKFDKFGLVQYETSEEEVVRLIENLSDGKAINENDIPTKIIKLVKFVLAPILSRIACALKPSSSALMKVFILIA